MTILFLIIKWLIFIGSKSLTNFIGSFTSHLIEGNVLSWCELEILELTSCPSPVCCSHIWKIRIFFRQKWFFSLLEALPIEGRLSHQVIACVFRVYNLVTFSNPPTIESAGFTGVFCAGGGRDLWSQSRGCFFLEAWRRGIFGGPLRLGNWAVFLWHIWILIGKMDCSTTIYPFINPRVDQKRNR